MGVTLFLITPGCLWPIGNQSGWGKCWGNGFIKSKTTQMTQNMLVSCSWVVKNKVVNVKQLYTDRMNGQQVKKLGLRFCQTSSHLPFNCIIVFSRSSPAMTWQLAESLRATCPAFWISIAYVNEKLNKMSLEPKTLQDIALFIGIFYALYISWKTGLEIIELFKLEGNSADCLPPPAQSRVTLSRVLKAVSSWVWVSPNPEASQSLWETYPTVSKKFTVLNSNLRTEK